MQSLRFRGPGGVSRATAKADGSQDRRPYREYSRWGTGEASPGLCAAPLLVKDGPVVQVGQEGEGADEGLAVPLGRGSHRVALEVQASQARQASKTVEDLLRTPSLKPEGAKRSRPRACRHRHMCVAPSCASLAVPPQAWMVIGLQPRVRTGMYSARDCCEIH